MLKFLKRKRSSKLSQKAHDYISGVAMLREAGIKIFGYVHTQYGERDKIAVKEEIKSYSEWYGVTEIFLDEGSSQHHIVSYYKEVRDYVEPVHNHMNEFQRRLILNTGCEPHSSYYDVADQLVTCENYWSDFQKLSITGARNMSLALIHTCSTENEMHKAVTKAAKSQFVGIFVTNLGMPNPWCALPMYWDAEVALVHRLGVPEKYN
eukprot:CFRG4320T1